MSFLNRACLTKNETAPPLCVLLGSIQHGGGVGFSRSKMEITEKDKARFWAKVDKGEPDECWEWTAYVTPNGYGQFGIRRKAKTCHRIVWVLENGPIPSDKQINHHCDNRACCNPSHLYLGTQAENMKDMKDRGRANGGGPCGEKQHLSKLTKKDVYKIFELRKQGLVQREIAEIICISRETISAVLTRKTWRHVEISGGRDGK